ncbi:MAG: methionyl-tRNA synthetase, partial [Salibacteraceae bacterium]
DEQWLKEWITTGKLDGEEQHIPSEWRNQVQGQCMSWIDGGLGARAMTRDLDWGVPVPLKEADGKVLYVWLDAPIGYISATKQWAADNGKNWEDYWKKDENTHLTHFIAKDNIVFHAIIFPILLKAHGDFNLPYNVPANEFLNLEGDKISTSREWAVWLHEYIAEFEGKEDELRYVLTSIAPENKDSEFTWKDYQTRVNSELVAILGNFVNRSLVLTQKYYNGVMPALGELANIDSEVLAEMQAIPLRVAEKIKSHKYRDGLAAAMTMARLGNKYLADTEPWKLAKTDPVRVATILHISNQIVANLAIVMRPFLPHTCDKLNQFLKQTSLDWESAGQSDLLAEGQQFEKPSLLFAKIEDAQIDAQIEKLNIRKAEKEKEAKVKPVLEPKENITFDEFQKMDLRIGTVLEAEKVKKADKLLKLKVDTGVDIRTIVSGIAEHFTPEEIVNKQVTVLMNLPPRKIRGVMSEGMLLMAENENGGLDVLHGSNANSSGDLIG